WNRSPSSPTIVQMRSRSKTWTEIRSSAVRPSPSNTSACAALSRHFTPPETSSTSGSLILRSALAVAGPSDSTSTIRLRTTSVTATMTTNRRTAARMAPATRRMSRTPGSRHLGNDVFEERVLPDNRDRVPCVHQIGDPEERAPAEGAPGVERRVVLRAEPAELEQDHGEGVTGGERRGGARRRGQVHRARLLGDAHVEHHLALARERGDGAAGQEDDRDTEPLEGRQDREDLIRLARVREGQHDVAAGHH